MTSKPPISAPVYQPSNPLVHELERVHDMLRRDLRACQDMAGSARAGAPAADLRAAVEQMAGRTPHLRLGVDCLRFCTLVHNHHGGEDGILFPLVRRDAPHLAPVVDRLEDDHRVVARLLDHVEAAVAQLEGPDTTDAIGQVVDALDTLSNHLLEHLTREEQALRPFLLSMDSWPTDERRSQ